MPIVYEANVGVDRVIAQVLLDPEMKRLDGLKIVGGVSQKISGKGEVQPVKGDGIVVRCVPACMGLVTDTHALVLFDYCRWTECNAQGQESLVHNALCRLEAVDSGGGVRARMKQPDLKVYNEHLSLHPDDPMYLVISGLLLAVSRKVVETMSQLGPSGTHTLN